MGLFGELKWRGLVYDSTPSIDSYFSQEHRIVYVGFDPTGDSLHVGSLVPIMLLAHSQRYGHTPIVLIGGATGIVGDPSGKIGERKLLETKQVENNSENIKHIFHKFLKFDNIVNSAKIVDNTDWISKISFLDFIRDVGKHTTINYMLAKDSVKSRIETGISFTEFSYQLIQAYDFLYLYDNYNCTVQLGGSDQWGNITGGMDFIKKKKGISTYALTAPLIKKSDGSKFGKSEEGNIWLTKNKTSVYKFYQFWLNTSDEDALNYLKYFTFLSKEEILDLNNNHKQMPEKRVLQKKLAEQLTIFVHSKSELYQVIEASEVLFSKGERVLEILRSMSEEVFNDIFFGLETKRLKINKEISALDLLANHTNFFSSKSELIRLIKSNTISINKKKVELDTLISELDLLNGKYLLIQKGKKKYFLIKNES